jgi:hypothetical protein
MEKEDVGGMGKSPGGEREKGENNQNHNGF